MSRTIEKFKVGDRIVQRMRKGLPRHSYLPMSGIITNIYWREGRDGEQHMVYEINGQPYGWLYEWDWLYD